MEFLFARATSITNCGGISTTVLRVFDMSINEAEGNAEKLDFH